MERKFDQSQSIGSMACNSHSLHTAHPHPPIQVTSSWPCPMARNLSLSALKSVLSASFMRSLTGSEPGLRIKTTGDKGVLCCRMASKLITGGCTYLAEGEAQKFGWFAQSSCHMWTEPGTRSTKLTTDCTWKSFTHNPCSALQANYRSTDKADHSSSSVWVQWLGWERGQWVTHVSPIVTVT